MDSRFFKYRNKFWVVFFLIVLIANRGIINYLLPLIEIALSQVESGGFAQNGIL